MSANVRLELQRSALPGFTRAEGQTSGCQGHSSRANETRGLNGGSQGATSRTTAAWHRPFQWLHGYCLTTLLLEQSNPRFGNLERSAATRVPSYASHAAGTSPRNSELHGSVLPAISWLDPELTGDVVFGEQCSWRSRMRDSLKAQTNPFHHAAASLVPSSRKNWSMSSIVISASRKDAPGSLNRSLPSVNKALASF